MLTFLDTEFTDLVPNPRLLSIGLVTEDGSRAFYRELLGGWRPDECNTFVQEIVLPQLEGEACQTDMQQLALELRGWIKSLDVPVTVAVDSVAWDWPWLERIFADAKAWPSNLAQYPYPLTADHLKNFDVFEQAVERAFEQGLRRQHALDDAKANRLGWIASEARQLWLDDIRPAPPEWAWVRTAAEAILAIELGCIDAVSLDHDLGEPESSVGNGYLVLTAIEAWAADGLWQRVPARIAVHSANPVARERMECAIVSIERLRQRDPG